MRINTSYMPLGILCQAASIRCTILGWPFKILCVDGENKPDSQNSKTHHYVNLLFHLTQHAIVGNGDPLQYMVRGVVHGYGCPHQIHMGKSSYRWDEYD